ncbi:type VI secretion system baseplate subunit TssE [Pseudomonas aeruginosa]|nr:type VI secretion system baseplate subunit TssE [Pseudomonas aeruginosa]
MPRSPGHGSLFERLDPDLPPRRVRARQELASERMGAFRRRLEWILNTRRGSAQSRPELGLADLNDSTIGSTDLLHRACEDIRATVARYGPGVRSVRVHPLMDGSAAQRLRFQVSCVVLVNNAEEQVELELMLRGPNRDVSVT